MIAARKIRIRIAAFTVATGALLVPLTLTPRNAVDVNEACADATCCRELNSVCDQDGEVTIHYYSADECAKESQ